MRFLRFFISTIIFSFLSLQFVAAQKNTKLENEIADSLTSVTSRYAHVDSAKVLKLLISRKEKNIQIITNPVISEIPLRPDNVQLIYKVLKKIIARHYRRSSIRRYSIVCLSDNMRLKDLIPNIYRTDSIDSTRIYKIKHLKEPIVRDVSKPYKIDEGLQNRNIALWQSHGRYYNQSRNRWMWQRARLFQIVEDLYTQSYVVPFLVPMLENAGANVFMPRERDTGTHEMIIDNDYKSNQGFYRDHSDIKRWQTDIPGFADPYKEYFQDENPFRLGSYRFVKSVTDTNKTSFVEWVPNVPKDDYYAVYVSYASVKNSAPDAHYTVYYKGGETSFLVNQKVGGGTWIYLGTFRFAKGKSNQCKVVLTNYSSYPGSVITADAVKIGGGMGNIGRYKYALQKLVNRADTDSTFHFSRDSLISVAKVSGYPRFTEGSRYWLQWAGVPDSVYSRTQGRDDYSDDFQSRGFWVNYLSGGSSDNPHTPGLGIPIDMSLAFHTDAGLNLHDSIIGTLGICTVPNTEKELVFKNGVSRWASRDLTDMVQTQIVNDIHCLYDTAWTRRGLWDKSYSESRVPEVPAMLLELLAHQNFADMLYGLDPRFRFNISRSVYKGILKYLSYNANVPYVVEPLPVKQLSLKFTAKNKVELRWKPVIDSLEPTARPERYVVYTRINDGGFDNGVLVSDTCVEMNIIPGEIYSYKVTAVNKGGESFPSEILSVCRAKKEKGLVLVVNGFTRVSGPLSFATDSMAGFENNVDAGVPYISDISFVGKQYNFHRTCPWINDQHPGFGASDSTYETKVISGNTFDFPYLHGKAIKSAGYSFVSCSLNAVTHHISDLKNYRFVDLILGKQKQSLSGNRIKRMNFKTFPLDLQKSLTDYCSAGGNLMLSGAYIGSDSYPGDCVTTSDSLFMANVLKYHCIGIVRCDSNKIDNQPWVLSKLNNMEISVDNHPNRYRYYLQSADIIEPADNHARSIFSYKFQNESAGIVYAGSYKTCCLGFPFETIKKEKNRNKLMNAVLTFFASKSTLNNNNSKK